MKSKKSYGRGTMQRRGRGRGREPYYHKMSYVKVTIKALLKMTKLSSKCFQGWEGTKDLFYLFIFSHFNTELQLLMNGLNKLECLLVVSHSNQ